MSYKVESLETNFGKGVRIEEGRQIYEQFSCRDNLFARVFEAVVCIESGQVVDGYKGTIFREPFKSTAQDYEQFRVLAERLEQISGEKIPKSKALFMDYNYSKGLEQKLSGIGADIRINLEDKEKLPKEVNKWLNSKAHIAGLVSSLSTYVGGFILGMGIPSHIKYILWMPTVDCVVGFLSRPRQGTFCGLTQALGFAPTKRFFRHKIRDSDYMLGKFMEDYQRLDAIGKSLGDQNKYKKQSKKADGHFSVLKEMFLFTEHQRGFSITYNSPDRDDIISFFDYILEGGNAPQLINTQAAVKKPETQEKPVETEPVETTFINPWKFEIPILGEKENE